ncbi:hypothetical protein AOLI_G00147180 [Acnodon oligacanthus]
MVQNRFVRTWRQFGGKTFLILVDLSSSFVFRPSAVGDDFREDLLKSYINPSNIADCCDSVNQKDDQPTIDDIEDDDVSRVYPAFRPVTAVLYCLMSQPAQLQVILADHDVCKLPLPFGIPGTVEELHSIICDAFGITGNFSLHYKDVDFEIQLQSANEKFNKDGTLFSSKNFIQLLPDILGKLAEAIYEYTSCLSIRQEIINEVPAISDFMKRWPALFNAAQINEEFKRLTTVSLESTFFVKIGKCTPKIMTLAQSKGGAAGLKIRCIKDTLLENNTADGQREAAIRCLMVYLGGPFHSVQCHAGV